MKKYWQHKFSQIKADENMDRQEGHRGQYRGKLTD